ncbi:hypothetical protein AKO1_011583 [Acrasis kona]|uniref:LXG domain-containing protein n=1 Tax=Acrasis kona TaxID=1008807 RepID=A0AAW2Z6K2_9EUKA
MDDELKHMRDYFEFDVTSIMGDLYNTAGETIGDAIDDLEKGISFRDKQNETLVRTSMDKTYKMYIEALKHYQDVAEVYLLNEVFNLPEGFKGKLQETARATVDDVVSFDEVDQDGFDAFLDLKNKIDEAHLEQIKLQKEEEFLVSQLSFYEDHKQKLEYIQDLESESDAEGQLELLKSLKQATAELEQRLTESDSTDENVQTQRPTISSKGDLVQLEKNI